MPLIQYVAFAMPNDFKNKGRPRLCIHVGALVQCVLYRDRLAIEDSQRGSMKLYALSFYLFIL